MKRAPYTAFGKTKLVRVVTYTNRVKDDPPKDTWDEEMWIERGEDWYGLESPGYRNCTVRIIERSEWLRSPTGEQGRINDPTMQKL